MPHGRRGEGGGGAGLAAEIGSRLLAARAGLADDTNDERLCIDGEHPGDPPHDVCHLDRSLQLVELETEE